MASSSKDNDIVLSAFNHDNSHLISLAAAAEHSCRMGKKGGSGRVGGGSFTIQEEGPASNEPVSGSGSGNGGFGGGVMVDYDDDNIGYEATRSCAIGMLADFDNGRQLAGAERQSPRLGGFDLSSGMGTTKNTKEEDEDGGDKQRNSTGTTPTAASTTPKMSLASAHSSVESSMRSSRSKDSLRSLINRNSSRKIMVSNLPRHSRRNKKAPKEMTWLRDTLSLTSSTHSDYITSSTRSGCRVSVESDMEDDIDLQDSTGEFGGMNGSSSRHMNGSRSSIMNGSSGRGNGRGGIIMNGSNRNGMNASSSAATEGARRMSGSGRHQRTVSSPAFLASMDIPELFPKALAATPLPAILASSVSSQSEVSSTAANNINNRDSPTPPVIDSDECEEGCEGCLVAEREAEKAQEDEYESEAPIKWITATIPVDEKEQLPPPPPRVPPPRESHSPRSTDRWGQDNGHDGADRQRRSPRTMSPPRRTETMPRGGGGGGEGGRHHRQNTDVSGGGRSARRGDAPQMDGSGGGRSGSRMGDESPMDSSIGARPRGRHHNMDGSDGRGVKRTDGLYPPPPLSVAQTMSVAPSLGMPPRRESVKYRSESRRPDATREQTHRRAQGPPRERPNESRRDLSCDEQDDISHRGNQYRSSPRYELPGSTPGYQPRDRYATVERPPDLYGPRDRSPGGYSRRDRSPSERFARDRSPGRHPRDRSPGGYSRRDRSPGGYSRRDRSPDHYGRDMSPEIDPRDRSPSVYSRRERDRRDRSPGRYPRDRSPERYPSDKSPERYPREMSLSRRPSSRTWAHPSQPQRRVGDDRSVYSRRVDDRSVYSRVPEEVYEQDFTRRGYDTDPYYGHQRGSCDRGRMLSPGQENRPHHLRDRNYANGHSEVHVRSSHRSHPHPDDLYHYDRSQYSHEEDPCRYGGGDGRNRSHSSRRFSRDNPAYDHYPGPPAFEDTRNVGRYHSSRDDSYNDRSYSRPPPPREQDQTGTRAGRHGAAPLSAPSRHNTNKKQGLDPELVDEELKRSGMMRKGNDRHSARADQDLLDEKLKSIGMTRRGSGDEPVSVEIAPGVRVALRRTHETMQAIAVDFYQSVSCLSCSIDIFSIADVSYVICPRCRVISPVGGQYFEGREIRRHGLGLGFTCESLFKMQAEIVQDRPKCEKKEPKYDRKEQMKAPRTEYSYEKRDRGAISMNQYY